MLNRSTSESPPEPLQSHEENASEPSSPSVVMQVPLAFTLAAASGFLGIAIEVMWFRGLALAFPGTVYVFALVLSAYLVGIGLGSLLVGGWFRARKPTVMSLGMLYIGVMLGCMVAQNLIPSIVPWSVSAFQQGWLTSWEAYAGWIGLIAVLAMLPATLAMGAALPLLIGLVTRDRDEASRVAGQLYAANTVAGVLGSLAGTFVFMPWLGVSRGLMVLALGYLAMGLVLVTRAGLQTRYTIALGGVWVLLLVSVLADLQTDINALRNRPDWTLLFYRDAPSATVSIYEEPDGSRLLMANNQYALSGTDKGTVAMQYRLGALPLKLHPQPDRALLIGFATGTTLASMAADERLGALDCVEIHDLLFELGSFFQQVNQKVYTAPKVTLIEGDGRRYLARPGPMYDVIVADLYVPRNPGVGSLYSAEHFQAVSGRLAPGGLFITWLPLWQLNAHETAVIVQTFLSVYPNAEGLVGHWSPARPILGLMAHHQKDSGLSSEGLDRAVEHHVIDVLRRAFPQESWPTPQIAPGVVSRRLLSSDQLRRWAGAAPINNLDRPFI
ncbi:MAG: hypothetical protein AAFS10_26390, partial [Myxococcota bacterium]